MPSRARIWRTLTGCCLVLILTLAQTASRPATAAAEPAPAPRPQGSVLRLAMSGAFRPFSATDATGRLVGFDADIARELARRLGRRPVLVQTDWAGMQAGLKSGKYDLICGSMAITPERLRAMDFSLPYYVSGAQVFARRGLKTIRGARIAVTEDSTYARYIASHPGRFPGARVVYYGSEAEIVAAMNTGKIDAFVSDRIVGGFYVRKGASGGSITPRGGLLYREACGIAARRGSGALVRHVNQALLAMVQDGTYSRIYEQWVGARPDLGLLLGSWGDFAGHIPQPAAAAAPASAARPSFAGNVRAMLPLLARGALLTLNLSLITAVLALITGSLVGVATAARGRWLPRAANAFIWVTRGTPLLVQLFMSYFVLATLANRAAGRELVGAFGAALIALVVNTTAYNAETLRGGINAVDKGQWDAAASLGMARPTMMRRVILPQALQNSLPSLGNNLVVLIKDTSLVGAITLIELTYSARNVVFQTGQAFLPFLLAAGFYLAIISAVTLAVKGWERHLQRSRQPVGRAI